MPRVIISDDAPRWHLGKDGQRSYSEQAEGRQHQDGRAKVGRPAMNRFCVAAAAVALAFPLGESPALTQTYPARPVHLVVGFPAGGGIDVPARLISQWLWDRLGQPFIVENRVGGGGNIATEAVVRAPADGYTLLLVSTTNAINPTL